MQDGTERKSFRKNIRKKDFFPQGPTKGELFPSKVGKPAAMNLTSPTPKPEKHPVDKKNLGYKNR
jgi:hypothetical protein